MNIERSQLRKISSEFRYTANRLLQSDVDDYGAALGKFLACIEKHDCLINYVRSCMEVSGISPDGLADDFDDVIGCYEKQFVLGGSDEREVALVYCVLKLACDKNVDVPRRLAYGYSAGKSYKDHLDEYNSRFVMVLVDRLDLLLVNFGIDMGVYDSIGVNISCADNGNAQIIVADRGATVNAQQVAPASVELETILRELIDEVRHESPDKVEEAQVIADGIKDAYATGEKGKTILKGLITGLKGLVNTTSFLSSLVTLSNFLGIA